MIRDGVRRCDLCASEMLGTKGADICYICCLCMDESRGGVEDWVCDHRELESYASGGFERRPKAAARVFRWSDGA